MCYHLTLSTLSTYFALCIICIVLFLCPSGVLSAPVPFIVGIHYSYFTDETCWDTSESRRNGSICAAPSENSYEELHAAVSSETVKVFIDDGRIDFGILGPPPALPENRGKKLLNELKCVV